MSKIFAVFLERILRIYQFHSEFVDLPEKNQIQIIRQNGPLGKTTRLTVIFINNICLNFLIENYWTEIDKENYSEWSYRTAKWS
jgi:hypothetical protein